MEGVSIMATDVTKNLVIFYSRPGCGRCKTIKGLMDRRNVQYQEITDEDEVISQALKYNCREMPFALIDGQLYGPTKLMDKIRGM